MSRTASVIANDGSITIIHNNAIHSIGVDHINYDRIVKALRARHYERLDKLLDVVATIRSIGNVTVDGDTVCWKGQPLHGVIAARILALIRDGGPVHALVNFLDNLMNNPSARSVNELYGFLEHNGFPITDDGCFLAYKAVNSNFRDKHTGKIDNSIGAVIPRLERNKVDDNCNNTCSFGYHAGTFEYAKGFASPGDHIMIVKINPADAVSVPTDHDAQKLRVTFYEVVREHVLDAPMNDAYEGDNCGDDWCDDCEDYSDYCSCGN